MKIKFPLRKVIERRLAHKRLKPVYYLKLECGHEVRKTQMEGGNRMENIHCKNCPPLIAELGKGQG